MMIRRSGLLLTLAGAAGGAFFWWTDPRFGRQRLAVDVVDRLNDARIGTIVGMSGSGVVLLIGLFLMTRRVW